MSKLFIDELVNKYEHLAPMKYYAPQTYNCDKARAMIENTNNGYVALQKFDGEWCKLVVGAHGYVKAYSRNISTVTGMYGDKTEHIPHIVREAANLPAGTVLLGELCFENLSCTSRDVGSILRCLPPKAVERQLIGPSLVFKTFDCLAFDGEDLVDVPYRGRLNTLLSIFNNYSLSCIQAPNICPRDMEFSDFLQEILAMGGEGIVIHSLNYLYAPGKRPAWSTLKVKRITQELELPVVDRIEPNMNYCGEAGEAWPYQIDGVSVTKPYYFGWKNGIVVRNGDTEVRVTSGLTDADREWLATAEAEEIIKAGGLVAVVSAMEITPDGSLRHPRLIRLRTDA